METSSKGCLPGDPSARILEIPPLVCSIRPVGDELTAGTDGLLAGDGQSPFSRAARARSKRPWRARRRPRPARPLLQCTASPRLASSPYRRVAKSRCRFADPVRAQSAIDLFTSNAYDFVIDGESYRPRQTPKLGATLVNDAQNDLRTNDLDPGRTTETPDSARRRRLGGRRRQPRLAGHGAGR